MTLQIDRINKADGSVGINTDYVISGSAKAYSRVDIMSSTVTVGDSFNTSSIVDILTGVTGFNLSNPMNNADYSFIGLSKGDASNFYTYTQERFNVSRTPSYTEINTMHYSTGTTGDPSAQQAVFHGDLA